MTDGTEARGIAPSQSLVRLRRRPAGCARLMSSAPIQSPPSQAALLRPIRDRPPPRSSAYRLFRTPEALFARLASPRGDQRVWRDAIPARHMTGSAGSDALPSPSAAAPHETAMATDRPGRRRVGRNVHAGRGPALPCSAVAPLCLLALRAKTRRGPATKRPIPGRRATGDATPITQGCAARFAGAPSSHRTQPRAPSAEPRNQRRRVTARDPDRSWKRLTKPSEKSCARPR